ncbi:magnesium transporter [Thiomicrospira microaerophila]|uniref:magnesium transporter n=1 Tax=Thiomicrospira microaerophila TaxID=406020 RepID=UPI00200D440E|nr:magnesium transporter [Thiomicrospira microaerophila]UQB41654.1 magnesium transporter [Thiomicrospira microaerophila]
MIREELLYQINDLFKIDNQKGLLRLVRNTPSNDLAEALDTADQAFQLKLLRCLPSGPKALLFSHLNTELQDKLIMAMTLEEATELLTHMPSDDRVDIYNRMPQNYRIKVMQGMAQRERDDILKMASFAEGTTGAMTTSDYVSISSGITVREALQKVRLQAPNKETIYTIYVTNSERQLEGTLSLRDLIMAAEDQTVDSIMRTEIVFAKAEWPREQTANLISRYDLLAIPVINGGNRLIGIVTVDDAMDVSEEEATEDFHKGGGTMALKNISMKDATVSLLYRKRVFWLVLLVFGNIFSGAGIAHFEDAILAYVALVFFLPLLIDSGGNAGAQSSTLMVRALATGDVILKDWFSMLGREFSVALLLGVTIGLAVATLGIFRGGYEIALVVSMSMVAIVIVGSVIGMSLPFILSRFKLDPAAASVPLITTIADGVGVIIFFSIAVMMLDMPADV